MASGKFLVAAAAAAGWASLFAGCADLCAQNTAMGQAEFYTPGRNTFTVPEGVTRIRVFLYGAGGGAGGSISGSQPGFNGGSGAFVEAVLDVTAGENLYVVVGAGGKGGRAGTFSSGIAGGASEIESTTGKVLASAGGGGGGISCLHCSGTARVGAGGEPGTAPAGSLKHPGPDGSGCGGGMTRCGYTPSSLTSDVSFGGRGFVVDISETETINGIEGYVYIEW